MVGLWYCGAVAEFAGRGPIGSVMTPPDSVNSTGPAEPETVTRSVYLPGAIRGVVAVTVSPVGALKENTVRPFAFTSENVAVAPVGPIADRANPNTWLRPTKSVDLRTEPASAVAEPNVSTTAARVRNDTTSS